eukprot:1160375-Pelagomonas_calceolata.AAC.3
MLGSCSFQIGKGVGIRAEFEFNKMNGPVSRRDFSRIKVGRSAWDRAHKDSISVTLVPGRGASINWGKQSGIPLPDCHHMDSTLHILSGFQCPVIRNMVTERHSIASRIILKVVSTGSYGSDLIHMDVGSADRLAQHDLHITEQVSTRVIPSYLFEPSTPDQARCTSSRYDAILVTPCPTYPNRPPTPPSHHALRCMRRNEGVRSSTTPARQLHELKIQNCHIHLTEMKYCEDTRPGAQLEAAQQQHSELCKQLQGAEITLYTILLGVGGTIYTAHTLDQLRKLGIDPQRST